MMNLAELANRKMKFRPSFGLMMRDLLLSREDVVFLIADSARAAGLSARNRARTAWWNAALRSRT